MSKVSSGNVPNEKDLEYMRQCVDLAALILEAGNKLHPQDKFVAERLGLHLLNTAGSRVGIEPPQKK